MALWEDNGARLSITGDAVYKGKVSHNGTLLNIGENHFTIAYSKLLNKAGTDVGTAKFGSGVFFDASQHNNNIYAGAPTRAGAIPVFAGIILREPAHASSYPIKNDTVDGYQNGMLCRQGFIIYKKGNVVFGASDTLEDTTLFKAVFQNWCMFVEAATGNVYFTPKASVVKDAADVLVGRVIAINPDDESVTVAILPSLFGDNTATLPTVTATAGTHTKTSLVFAVTSTTDGTIFTEIKEGTGSYKDVGVSPVLKLDGSTYKTNLVIPSLTAGTEYDVRITVFTPAGRVVKEVTGVSTLA